MILVEVAVSIYLFLSIPSSVYSFIAISLIFEITAFLNLINKDANPEYKASWSAVILLLPIAGAVIYFIFYSRHLSKKEARIIKNILSFPNNLIPTSGLSDRRMPFVERIE